MLRYFQDGSCSFLGAAHGSALDSLFVGVTLQNALHINSRRDDMIGIDFAGLDQLLDFSDGARSGGCHHGIKIARCFAVDKISRRIALRGFDEREVGP